MGRIERVTLDASSFEQRFGATQTPCVVLGATRGAPWPAGAGCWAPSRLVVELGAEQRLDWHAAIINHERLTGACVVLVGNLAQREQCVLWPVAREHHDGRQRAGRGRLVVVG